jgi:mannose-6-phosphate isomerase
MSCERRRAWVSENSRERLGPQTATRIDKPWGYQLLFTSTEPYSGGVNVVCRGHSLSLQYHRQRDETLFLHQGHLQVELEDEAGVMRTFALKPGQSIRFVPLRRHRISALEDSVIFEVSTPQMDDVVRVADRYGRAAVQPGGEEQ